MDTDQIKERIIELNVQIVGLSNAREHLRNARLSIEQAGMAMADGRVTSFPGLEQGRQAKDSLDSAMRDINKASGEAKRELRGLWDQF